MAVHSIGSFELNKLQFHEQDLLDVIDNLRSKGLGQHVSLPQLIVCGDQSAGKSSVLEAISGIPFPTNDGLCTVFATEMVLRKADESRVNVRISPDPETTRSEADLQRLLEFGGAYTKSADFQLIFDNAKDAMGISKGNAFSNDRLRIEVSGPDLTSLTIVDLPGLFHAGENSNTVQRMVKNYMENPRSVILAVISARSDVGLQIVLDLTKVCDPSGSRTIGIITKPDTLSIGSPNETKILGLVRNEDPIFNFRHGWHVLRNRNFEEAETSSKDRDDVEKAFFSQGVWKGVVKSLVGIDSLRPRLNSLLLNQIKNELPKLIGDIENAIQTHQRDLDKLGDSRVTVDEQRAYLIKISQSFQSIVNAAIDGSYSNAFFKDARSDEGYKRRLRAVIQNANNDFREEMQLRGHRVKIVDSVKPPKVPKVSSFLQQSSDIDTVNPTAVSRGDYLKSVMKLLKRSRGRELPGMFNPLIVSDLFKEQSEPWESLCGRHVENAIHATGEFLDQTVSHLADVAVAEKLLREIIDPAMNQLSQNMSTKLAEVLRASQELHPITYNHYFTDNFQEIKAKRQRATITAVVSRFFGVDADNELFEGSVDPSALISALSEAQKEPDMDKFASSELIDYMEAYYKVALKTVIDNVAVEVVEEALVQKLQDILSPISIGEMKAGVISKIGGESPESQVMREELTTTLITLREGLEICKPFAARSKKAVSRHSTQHESKSREDLEQEKPKLNAKVDPFVPVKPTSIFDRPFEPQPKIIGTPTANPKSVPESFTFAPAFGFAAITPKLGENSTGGEFPFRKQKKCRGTSATPFEAQASNSHS